MLLKERVVEWHRTGEQEVVYVYAAENTVRVGVAE